MTKLATIVIVCRGRGTFTANASMWQPTFTMHSCICIQQRNRHTVENAVLWCKKQIVFFSLLSWLLFCVRPRISNVTGRHWGPKGKLRAAEAKASGWLQSTVTKMDVMSPAPSLQRTACCDAFSASSVASRAFFVLCVYSKFGYHPHPLGYLCVKVRFFRGLHCWKIAYSVTHYSLTAVHLMRREPTLSLRKVPLSVVRGGPIGFKERYNRKE